MAPAGVVTVADLLSRNAAVTTKLPVVTETATTGVSVGSLLRREGRAPHTVDRPVQPRGHQQIDPPKADVVVSAEAAPVPAAKKTAVKRGAVAAGAILAVGSVVGAAVLSEVAPTGTDAQGATNSYPGQGRLNASQPEAPVLSGVVDSAAAGDALDAGTAPPTSWTPVAFPSAVAGVPAGIAGASSDAASDSGTAQNSNSSNGGGTSASGSTADRARSGSASGSDDSSFAPSTVANGATAGAESGDTESGGTVKQLGDGLGNTVQGVGGALPDAVGDPVEGLGGATKDVGSTLDNTVTSLLRSNDSDETSAPQRDDESSSSRDNESRDSSGDDDRNDNRGDDDGGSSRGGDSGKSSGGLLGGIGKVAAGLLGG